MKKIIFLSAFIIGLFAFSSCFTSCDNGSSPETGRLSATGNKTTAVYTITFNANDGSEKPAVKTQKFTRSGNDGTNVTLEKNTFTHTNSDFEFKGWALSADSSSVSYKDGETCIFYGNKTLYAIWGLPSYSYYITFDGNGGATAAGESKIKQKVSGDYTSFTAVLKANLFERAGYSFLGWAKSNTAEDSDYSDGYGHFNINGDTTLYAVWCSNADVVKITLNKNDGSGESKTLYAGKNKQFRYYEKLNFFNREFASLIGWAETSNGNIKYTLGLENNQKPETLQFTPVSDMALYAVWKENPKITFHGNGGMTADGKDSLYQYIPGKYVYEADSQTAGAYCWNFKEAATLFTLTANPFLKSFYSFAGWAGKSNSSVVKYADRAELYPPHNNIDLYAVFNQKNVEVNYTKVLKDTKEKPYSQSFYIPRDCKVRVEVDAPLHGEIHFVLKKDSVVVSGFEDKTVATEVLLTNKPGETRKKKMEAITKDLTSGTYTIFWWNESSTEDASVHIVIKDDPTNP